MSRQVTVDYQGISIQAQAECDRAVHSLCQIDKVLEKIHKVANKLETSKVKEYEIYLQKSKNAIKKKIENFKNALEKYKEKTKSLFLLIENINYFSLFFLLSVLFYIRQDIEIHSTCRTSCLSACFDHILSMSFF